jgi:hypothetical protein
MENKIKLSFPFSLQSHYYHLTKTNIHIWEKFVRGNPGFFDLVEYSFPLEVPESWTSNLNELDKEKYFYLYSYKIDVLASKNNLLYLIEIKPNAGHIALGQILTYEYLFNLNYPDIKDYRLMVITNKAKDGMANLYLSKGINLIETGVCPDCEFFIEK